LELASSTMCWIIPQIFDVNYTIFFPLKSKSFNVHKIRGNSKAGGSQNGAGEMIDVAARI